VACGFTPIGVALILPLEYSPDGIILLGGTGFEGIWTVAALSRDYPTAPIPAPVPLPRRQPATAAGS